MKIQPVASPSAIQQPQSNAQAAKARAVAAFQSGGQPAAQVVQNQNSIAPEEMGAIMTSSSTEERQADTNEATTEETNEVAAPAEEAEKPAEDPALSRQFAQLARQEKALRAKAQQQDQALRAREQALLAREQELTTKSQVDMSKYISKDQFKQDPLSVLAAEGVSYEELTQQIISQQPVDPRLQNTIRRLEEKIQSLERETETTKKSAADQQTQAYQAAVKQIATDVEKLVKTDSNYEAIRATRSTKDVVELIEQTYAKDGILLSIEEAAQQVEDYLIEEGTKIARLEKIKKKMQEVAPKALSKPAQTPAVPVTKQTQPMKTLTNATSSTRQLSAKERAILAFKGELKS